MITQLINWNRAFKLAGSSARAFGHFSAVF